MGSGHSHQNPHARRHHPHETLITSRSALLASSNYTKNWQRDHNYYITAAAKPTLYMSMKDEFQRMWNDTANYEDFYPLKPRTATLVAPGTGAVDVSTLPKLEWKQTPWAVTFDVYLGTTTSNMTKVARVNATLTENPPSKYSYTVTQALQPSTRYFWKVVSRTFATDLDPTIISTSSTYSFTTGAGTGGGGGSGPYTGSPVALPGTIEAENFDKGGSGVAYNDTTSVKPRRSGTEPRRPSISRRPRTPAAAMTSAGRRLASG